MRFLLGFLYYVRGIIFFLVHPKLWGYALLPCIISFISYEGIIRLFNWSSHYLLSTFQTQFATFPAWIGKFIIYPIAGLWAILLFIIANLLSGPSQKILSLKTEEALLGTYHPITSSKSGCFLFGIFLKVYLLIRLLIGGIFVLLFYGLTFLIYWGLRAIFPFDPTFILIIGQAVAVLWIGYHTAFSFIDVTLARQGLSYSQKKQKLHNNTSLMVGFGCACIGFLLVPAIEIYYFSLSTAIIAIPCSVVTSTLLVLEKIDSVKKSAKNR